MEEQEQSQNQLQETGEKGLEQTNEQIQETAESFSGEDVFAQASTMAEKFGEYAWDFGPKLLLAILIVVIGFWLIKKINLLISAALKRTGLDAEVSSFLASLANILMKMVVVLAAAGVVGIEITAILGLLATAGVAIGLALQGSLSNFAAGLLIMIFKPYRVGDWVEIQEKFGKVEEVEIFNTKIVSPGLKTLVIPNGQVIEGVVTNFSEKGAVRLELEVSMPYSESFPKVKELIINTLATIPEILDDPKPEIGIVTYDSHSIIVAIRPFIEPDNYWHVTYETYRKVKNAFHEAGIQVAYSEGVELGKIGV